MHHSDLQMDCTTALRFHTGEIFFSSILRLVVIPILGMDFSQWILYEACLRPVILFHHSNVALPEKFDRMFRALIVTPNMHRVHHSELRPETDSNFSSVLSFWDRLFRSFKQRKDPKTLRYGLPYLKDEKWQSFLGMIETPWAKVGEA